MFRNKRWLSVLFAIVVLIVFSACNSEALKKPTGLEDDSNVLAVQEDDSTENDAFSVKDDEETEVADNLTEDDNGTKEDENDLSKNDRHPSDQNKVPKHVTNSKQDSSNDSKKETQKQTNETSQKKPNQQSTQATNSNSTASGSKTNSNNVQTTIEAKNANNNKNVNKETEEKAAPPAKSNELEVPKKDTVTISIVISSSEVPLSATVQEIETGDTVLDVFYKVTKRFGIQQSVRGSGSNAYIEGIANVYEFDRGSGSGWMYRVNGIFPDRSVGSVPVQDGDRIDILYTLDLGNDLNAKLQPFRR